jgi:hypothetical protein
MTMRVYVDTSVIGGCLDDEFANESRALLDMARRGHLVLLVSDLLLEELAEAPPAVLGVLASLPPRPQKRWRPQRSPDACGMRI